MVVVPDRYDFTFSISWKKTPNRRLIHSKLKLLVTEKFQRHIKVTLEIRTVKPTWWNTFSKKIETLPKVLTSFQTIYLTNLDGATDRVTSQSSERIDFYCDHKEAYTKMFAYIKFICDNIRPSRVIIGSPDTDLRKCH